ncbi:50S ribosomal protein L29 [Verrucomicrobium sp. 3C]|uniref:50S ribosomal protein L29 n=1 Tax=Verrucomicrobium sp. 3C TaxID=1134055 RepID=UPI000362B12D|nr:50S ribosomal protein L29 [Verrucomicrobium sp. 3C]
MKTTQLRALSSEELLSKGTDVREEIFRLRLQQSTGSLEKPSRLPELRKLVARVETLLREAELGIGPVERRERNQKEKA